jgi:endonuclease/exonuclease/phosphatase family metal-dependent hydrolase
MIRTSRRLLLALMLGALLAGAQTLRVMSFNVRYPARTDGPNRWEFRRDLLVETIREKSPDVMGTQELYYEQGQYIVEKLPEYAWLGISRRGSHEDEHMGVFYKKDRLRVLDSGNFWLSETPETPGSMSWGVNLLRMVTWGYFELRDGGRRFYFYNTHFPHRREDHEARLRAARLIAERIAKLDPAVPFVMTGDFNAPAGGEVYQVFAGSLQDGWLRAARRTGPECTFGGFKGVVECPRIDWILYRGPFRVLEAETVTRNWEGRYPSDHYPVFAVLEFIAKQDLLRQ